MTIRKDNVITNSFCGSVRIEFIAVQEMAQRDSKNVKATSSKAGASKKKTTKAKSAKAASKEKRPKTDSAIKSKSAMVSRGKKKPEAEKASKVPSVKKTPRKTASGAGVEESAKPKTKGSSGKKTELELHPVVPRDTEAEIFASHEAFDDDEDELNELLDRQ